MGRSIRFLLLALAACSSAPSSRGEVIVDHQPHPFGGPGSDTSFYYVSSDPFWQLSADDIPLTSDGIVGKIVWWGFYGGVFDQSSTLPPLGSETMRVRFYIRRPGEDLPGVVAFDASFVDANRFPTGRIIRDARDHAEYQYEVDLESPLTLSAGTTYWLEITQIGDADSTYRWEQSLGDGTPFAFLNPLVPDWRRATLTSNLAFQLWEVPEPATAGVFGVSALFVTYHHRIGRERRRRG